MQFDNETLAYIGIILFVYLIGVIVGELIIGPVIDNLTDRWLRERTQKEVERIQREKRREGK